jgi:hypothetical protein
VNPHRNVPGGGGVESRVASIVTREARKARYLSLVARAGRSGETDGVRLRHRAPSLKSRRSGAVSVSPHRTVRAPRTTNAGRAAILQKKRRAILLFEIARECGPVIDETRQQLDLRDLAATSARAR